MPVLPRLIMEITGADVAGATRMGGYLLIVFAVLQFLFGSAMGNLSDAFGRRPVLLVSLLAFGVNYTMMGFAPSFAWLFVGRALTGMAGAVYAPANAYVADITTPDKRAQSFGMISATFGLGFVLGPAIGGIVGEAGPRAPFFVAGGLAVVNFVYGLFVLPESLPKEHRRPFSIARANPVGTLRAFRGQPRILRFVLAAFFWQLAFQVYPSTWAYYAIAKFQLSSGAIGATLALSGLSMAISQSLVTGRLVKRLGELSTAIIGAIVGMAAFLAYAFMTESWMLWPVLLLGGLQGAAMPAMNAIMSKELGPERQGELQGGMASVMGISSVIGPLVLTQTLAHFSRPDAEVHFPGAAFALAALLALVSLALLVAERTQMASLPATKVSP
jgi:DHA1 family tetracycline resistance protein-like MFS transporter